MAQHASIGDFHGQARFHGTVARKGESRGTVRVGIRRADVGSVAGEHSVDESAVAQGAKVHAGFVRDAHFIFALALGAVPRDGACNGSRAVARIHAIQRDVGAKYIIHARIQRAKGHL